MPRLFQSLSVRVPGLHAVAALLAGLFAGPLAGPCAAQPEIQTGSELAGDVTVIRPDSAQRVVRVFDFEEQDSNPTPVPFFFIRTQNDPSIPRDRPGFPPWNAAALDYNVAAEGKGSLRLPTRGGSTAAAIEPGVVPVFANADYLVTCLVRTEGLTRAGAAVEARLLDRSGVAIRGATWRSDVIRSDQRWTPVRLEVPGEFDDAAFLQVELQLLQPQQAAVAPDAGSTIEDHCIWPQDYAGAANFDTLSIAQLPRIELRSASLAGIVLEPEQPTLELAVRDLTGEPLTLRLSVFDADGVLVDRDIRQTSAGRTVSHWSPKIDRFGWYRCTLEVIAGEQVAGSTWTDLVFLARSAWPSMRSGSAGDHDAHTARDASGDSMPRQQDAERFGIAINSLSGDVTGQMQDLLRRIGPGAVTIPVWERGLTRQGLQKSLDRTLPLVDSVLSDWREVTLALGQVPDELALPLRIDSDDAWSLLSADRKLWSDYLDTMLDKYGQVIRRWQIGSIGDDRAFWLSDLRRHVSTLDQTLGRLVPGPVITVPWRIDRGLSPALLEPVGTSPTRGPTLATVALVPPESGPGDIELFASAWRRAAASAVEMPELTLAIDAHPDRERVPPREAASMVARRAIEAWAAFSPARSDPAKFRLPPEVRLSLVEPWTIAKGRKPRVMPAPELAAWRTAMDHLAGRSVVGEIQIGDGLRCVLLAPRERRGEGAIVAWREAALPEDATLRLFLGPGNVRQFDVFGNVSPVSTEPSRYAIGNAVIAPAHVISLDESPIYIEGVDLELIRFASSLRITPSFIISTDQTQEHVIELTNPWSTAAEGLLTIVQPGGFDPAQGVRDRRWTITPRAFRFSIPAGQSQQFPLGIALSPAEDSGKRNFVTHVELTSERSYGVLEITTPVEVGLKGVRLDLSIITEDRSTGDLVIEARVSNFSPDPLTAELSAFAPSFPRSKASVSDLAPGGEAVRRFVYPRGFSKLKGERVVVGLGIPDTGARLNKSVAVP